jgi:hypothetical protein
LLVARRCHRLEVGRGWKWRPPSLAHHISDMKILKEQVSQRGTEIAGGGQTAVYLCWGSGTFSTHAYRSKGFAVRGCKSQFLKEAGIKPSLCTDTKTDTR